MLPSQKFGRFWGNEHHLHNCDTFGFLVCSSECISIKMLCLMWTCMLAKVPTLAHHHYILHVMNVYLVINSITACLTFITCFLWWFLQNRSDSCDMNQTYMKFFHRIWESIRRKMREILQVGTLNVKSIHAMESSAFSPVPYIILTLHFVLACTQAPIEMEMHMGATRWNWTQRWKEHTCSSFCIICRCKSKQDKSRIHSWQAISFWM